MPPIVAEHGASAYRIVTGVNPPPVVQYAARELQHFIREATGATLPVQTESEAGDVPALLAGPSARSDKALPPESLTPLGPDGVWVRTSGRDIVLRGQNPRGHLYSVYEFLERCLGIQFLAWDCTIVPRIPVLDAGGLDIAYTPPFMYREILYFNAFDSVIAPRHRLNGPFTHCGEEAGLRLAIHPYVHSFSHLVPPKAFSATHPEYFSLINGQRVPARMDSQLCLSNPEVREIIVRKVLEWMEQMPDVDIFDVSQNDGGGPCECATCQAIVEEEDAQHGPILRLVNEVADAAAGRFPGKWVETLAYHYTTKPPRKTVPRDNVIIRLCHQGDYFQGFEANPLGADFAEHLRAWSRLTRNIFVWHYATNFGHYLAPNQNLGGLARDLKFYGANGVRGVMVQANYESPGGELAELRQYLAAQLLWDPARDPADIRRRFCKGYYGAAAGTVLEFLARMDREAERGAGAMHLVGYANWNPRETVAPEFVRDSIEMLEGVRAGIGDPVLANRLDKLLLPMWYMQLKYPGEYGLEPADAPALVARVKEVAKQNAITHMREVILALDENMPEVERKEAQRMHASMAPWVALMEGRYGPKPEGTVFDLYCQLDAAELEDCLVWRPDQLDWEGALLPTIFHHPPERGLGKATYNIALPALHGGERLELRFFTAFSAPTVDGVRFAVLIDGSEHWGHVQTALPPERHALDLTPWAGRGIRLTLQVDPRNNMSYDWAHWGQPRISLVRD